MQGIETIHESLVAELNSTEAKWLESKATTDELADVMARLQASIEALKKTKSGKANKKEKKPQKQPSKKSSPTQIDVREVSIPLVEDNPGIDKMTLKDLTAEKLTKERGLDLKGFPMRWDEVFRSDTFTVDEQDRVSIPNSQAGQGALAT